MDLEQQIQVLIENAPQDGTTPKIVEAIAPVLTLIANQLRHSDYHILQTLDQGWVVTTLSNRAQPNVEKNVIYAFPTLKDATDFQSVADPQIIVATVPVTHILFQMLAIDTITSIVFFNTPGNLTAGTEVRRDDLQQLIQIQLQQIHSTPRSYPSNLPPDIA
jgi:putative heme iron utilization protein